MKLRDQIVALTERTDTHVRCVMVFPKARVTARFGSTGNVHCLEVEHVRDYIDNPKNSRRLSDAEVARYVSAVNALATMDEQFTSASTIEN